MQYSRQVAYAGLLLIPLRNCLFTPELQWQSRSKRLAYEGLLLQDPTKIANKLTDTAHAK